MPIYLEAANKVGGLEIGAHTGVLPWHLQNLFMSEEQNRPPPRRLPQSNEFKKLENSNPKLNSFVESINRVIEAYNKEETSQPKIKALDRMMAVIKHFDVHLPPQTLAQSDELHVLKSDLFQQIKQAYAENGVHSMAKEGSSPIADILSNMSQEYADKLMEILLRNIKNKSELEKNLKSLYPSDEENLEANAWRKFLSGHSIEFLGGNNSTNFKVTNIEDSRVNVLKVDNRLNNPRNVEQHLREEHSDILTPIDADRQVKGTSPEDSSKISRTLLVTDFCPLGSLDSYSKKRHDTQKYLTTSILMGQMAEAFKGIQDANCMFPDAKAPNWLIDSNGRIRIADTKSFLFTDESGEYNRSVPGNKYIGMISTNGYITSEMQKFLEGGKKNLNAENVHASLLGRNIYQCLTGQMPYNFNYNLPIFLKSPGKEYKELIEKLVKDPPHERMSLEDAQKELQNLGVMSSPKYKQLIKCSEINTDFDLKPFVDNQLVLVRPVQELLLFKLIDDLLSPLKTLSEPCTKSDFELMIKYQTLRNDIESLQFGYADSQMQYYLTSCDEAICPNEKLDLRKLQVQIHSMEIVKAGLTKPENEEVRNIIKKYDEKQTEWFSINMGAKARMIEDAMANIPIEERANLLESKTPNVKELFKALAWHRINPFAKPVDDKGNIVVSSSANTFKEFKNRFNITLEEEADEQSKSPTENSPKT
jgi:hypothetical protein